MKHIKLVFALLLFNAAITTARKQAEPEVRILVLIIASDDTPFYRELQKIWRSYMHYDRNHVQAYFIKGHAQLPVPWAFDKDTLWSRTEENLVPGILNKTILSLEAFGETINKFDYVLRTNLSSFYFFPRLLAALKKLPRQKVYYASGIGGPLQGGYHAPTIGGGNYVGIGSGCGFIISQDVTKLLIEHKSELLNQSYESDDVVIGYFLRQKNIPLIPHARLDLTSIDLWNHHKNRIPQHVFQFRLKNMRIENRLTDEVAIHKQLRNAFYASYFYKK